MPDHPAPAFTVHGELSDAAIRSLARLLLSLVKKDEAAAAERQRFENTPPTAGDVELSRDGTLSAHRNRHGRITAPVRFSTWRKETTHEVSAQHSVPQEQLAKLIACGVVMQLPPAREDLVFALVHSLARFAADADRLRVAGCVITSDDSTRGDAILAIRQALVALRAIEHRLPILTDELHALLLRLDPLSEMLPEAPP